MKPLEGSDDVFRFLISRREPDGDGETDLIALFTFALVEQDRIEWAAHRSEQGLAIPTGSEARAWYADKPQPYFEDKLRRGEQWFAGFARAYLKDEVEADRERAVQHAVQGLRTDIEAAKTVVVAAVGSIKDESAHWWRGASQGALGNLLFAVVVIFFLWITAHPADLIAWGRARLGL